MTHEKYTDVPGLEWLLAISQAGSVLRKARMTPGGPLAACELKPHAHTRKGRYAQQTVTTTVGGRRRRYVIRSLLRRTFKAPVLAAPRKPSGRVRSVRVEAAGEWRAVSCAPGYFAFENGAIAGPSGVSLIQRYNSRKPYRKVCLRKDKKQLHKSVHLLVLEAFAGPRPPGMVGCHGQQGATDNSIANLRWDTPENNTAERVVYGKLRKLGLL